MENYDLNIKPEDEKEITIKSIHIYPVRGVPGLEVQESEVIPGGLKWDRIWAIVNADKSCAYDNRNSEIISYLKLAWVEGELNKIKLYLQDDKCFPEV